MSAEAVPQIFIEETQRAVRVQSAGRSIPARGQASQAAFAAWTSTRLPELKGFVSRKARDNAEVLLGTPSGSRCLARWQYGLGKIVVFTSDVKNRWAVNWLDWPGYGKLWAQVTREVMRRDSGEALDFRVCARRRRRR